MPKRIPIKKVKSTSKLNLQPLSPSITKSIDRIIEKHRNWLSPYNYRKTSKRARSHDQDQNKPGITVITSTIRPEFMNSVFENYMGQTYKQKELIVVLNKNSMDITVWKEKAKRYPNVRIYQLDEEISFGECYNFCVKQANYDYIAPFDDDDYYAPNYLKDIVNAFQTSGADVVGKKTRYIYFMKYKILALANPNNENCFVEHIDGPTLSFHKRVFEKIQFSTEPGIDTQFCKDCVANNIKIYSTNKYNHVYIRHAQTHSHTWKISDSALLSWCEIIAKTNNYKDYIAK